MCLVYQIYNFFLTPNRELKLPTPVTHFIHPFLSQLIASNFPSVPIVFHQFFTWIALGDVDLRFSLMMLKKSVLLRKLNELHNYINNVIGPYRLMV